MKNLKAFVMLLALLMPWQVQGYEVTQVVKQIKGIRYIIEAADSYVLNEQVLLVKPKTDDNSVLKNVQIVHTNELGFFHISVPKGIDIEEYATILRESGQFEIVEYVGEIKYEDFPCDTIPNDIKYGNQWYVDNINLSGAWALTTGNSNSQLMAVPPYESIGECYPVGTTWDEVYCSDMETPENYYYRSMLDEAIYERIRYTVTSQTLQVGEQTYKSVERKWIEGVGKLDAMLADKTLYLREDNGKIYVYDNDTKKETLFYDFNKIPFLGTLLEGNYADYGMHTDGLGDGADYDVIDWYDGRFVIRGIGYSFGIISKWSMGSYEGRGMTLDSFTRNGVLVYRKTYGTPDAITTPTEQKTSQRTVYDLQGRKTDASSTQSKDIIIRNGRKYINK